MTVTSFSPPGSCGFSLPPGFPSCWRTAPSFIENDKEKTKNKEKTRQSKQCGFSINIFDNSKSKSTVRLVRAEKMVLCGLVFARKITRMILIQNI